MTQSEFSKALCIPLSTLSRVRVLPDPVARSLLTIVAKNSKIVLRAPTSRCHDNDRLRLPPASPPHKSETEKRPNWPPRLPAVRNVIVDAMDILLGVLPNEFVSFGAMFESRRASDFDIRKRAKSFF
jgi:hypothetical protein